MTAWSLWALAQADRVDPVLARVFLQPVSEEDAEEDGSESTQPGNGCASTITTHALPTSAWHPNRWYTRLRRGVSSRRCQSAPSRKRQGGSSAQAAAHPRPHAKTPQAELNER